MCRRHIKGARKALKWVEICFIWCFGSTNRFFIDRRPRKSSSVPATADSFLDVDLWERIKARFPSAAELEDDDDREEIEVITSIVLLTSSKLSLTLLHFSTGRPVLCRWKTRA